MTKSDNPDSAKSADQASPLSAQERARLEGAIQGLQAEVEVYRTLLFAFLVNTMAARPGMLDGLMAQVRFLLANQSAPNLSPEDQEDRRKASLLAFDEMLERLEQAETAMQVAERDGSLN